MPVAEETLEERTQQQIAHIKTDQLDKLTLVVDWKQPTEYTALLCACVEANAKRCYTFLIEQLYFKNMAGPMLALQQRRYPWTSTSFYAWECASEDDLVKCVTEAPLTQRIIRFRELLHDRPHKNFLNCNFFNYGFHFRVVEAFRSTKVAFTGWDLHPIPDELTLLKECYAVVGAKNLYTFNASLIEQPQYCTPIQWHCVTELMKNLPYYQEAWMHVPYCLLNLVAFAEKNLPIRGQALTTLFLRVYITLSICRPNNWTEQYFSDKILPRISSQVMSLLYNTTEYQEWEKHYGVWFEGILVKRYAQCLQESELHATLSDAFALPLQEMLFISNEVTAYLVGTGNVLAPRLTPNQQVAYDQSVLAGLARRSTSQKRPPEDFSCSEEPVAKRQPPSS